MPIDYGTNNVSSSGNINVSGIITATSGNFTALRVNNTGVSISGHTHLSSDITDFNSSVSGLISGIYASLSGTLNQFASTSSSQLASIISDETGSGLLVFNNSPTFTGVPLVPTANSGTNTNQIASTAFVRTEISNLVSSAPEALDTLNELASALGNDANFSTTVTNSLAGKANLSGASFTGSVTAPTGNFTVLQQNGTNVSVSGHTHTSSDITDFNSSVSGLLTPYSLSSVTFTAGSGLVGGGNLTSNRSFDIGQGDGISVGADSISVNNTVIRTSGNPTFVGLTVNDASGIQLGGSNDSIVLFGKISYNLGINSVSYSYDDSAGNSIQSRELLIGNGVSDPSVNNPIVFFAGNSGVGVTKFLDTGASYTANRLFFDVTGPVTPNFDSANTILRTTTGGGNNITLDLPSTSGTLALTSQINTTVITGVLSTAKGGTGRSTYTNGQLLIGSGTTLVPNTLTAGNNISITPGSGTITISSTATGGGATISNSGLNRLLTSDGSTSGIVGQANLTFNESLLNVTGSGSFSNNVVASGFVRTGGTSSQFLKADGSVDNNSYQLALTNPVTGIGTSGYVPRWNSTNSLTSGIIFDNGTNVGIGTTTPSGQLHVLGTGIISSTLGINNTNPQYSLDVSGTGNFNSLTISGVPIGEIIDDEVAGLLVAGSGINLNYNDTGNSLTINSNLSTSLANGSGINFSYDSGTDTLSIALSGHNHLSSDISNFNSSVSGLLPTISNSGDNRVLTSTGSTVGVNAENNLTFNGNLLSVTGSGVFSSGLNVSETTNVDKLRTNKSYSEKVSAVSISSGTLNINLDDANLFTCPLNANITTFNVSNVPSVSGIAISFSVLFTADGTARTVSWPSGTKWPDGSGPTLTSTNNKIDLLSFVSVDQGSSWLGFVGGKNF